MDKKKDEVRILLEITDEEQGNVKFGFDKELREICIINGKIEKNPVTIYNIKLRNKLCRDKKYDHIIE